MEHEISPSTLKNVVDTRWGCDRCFWLRVKRNIKPPEPTGLGKLHVNIHQWLYAHLADHWIDILPKGKLIETELMVKARPVNGITLWGYLDGLIELDDGGYAIMDAKTTSSPALASRNYALQVNTYAYCLTNAQDDYPHYTPVKRLGILTFTGQRFGVNTVDCAGIVGKLAWHEVRIESGLVGAAVGRAIEILASDALPTGRVGCEWCAFYRQLGVEVTKFCC